MGNKNGSKYAQIQQTINLHSSKQINIRENKRKSRMNNPETQATMDTSHRRQTNKIKPDK